MQTIYAEYIWTSYYHDALEVWYAVAVHVRSYPCNDVLSIVMGHGVVAPKVSHHKPNIDFEEKQVGKEHIGFIAIVFLLG